MTKIKLLFVEDDTSFAFVIKGSLELSGNYEVETASNGKEGLDLFDTFNPDVIVADIEMPILNGIEMVKKIRQKNEFIPILLATGHTTAQDVLDGYDLNVDNFIKKPYLPEELNAHIRAILKRVQTTLIIQDNKVIVSLCEYVFNVDDQALQWKTETFRLTGRETKVLWKLYEQREKLVTRESILKELWGNSDFFTSRSLDVFINTLRKYLSNDPKIRIETIRGKGFRLRTNND
jgi:DNA-binding response OmpR family regulator